MLGGSSDPVSDGDAELLQLKGNRGQRRMTKHREHCRRQTMGNPLGEEG